MKEILPLYSIFSHTKIKDIILSLILIIITILISSSLDWSQQENLVENWHFSASNKSKIEQLEDRIIYLEQKLK